MRHHIFIPDYQFQKVGYFYVSLGNNFFTVFVEAPLVVEALGNCPVCPPPLNPALACMQYAMYGSCCYFDSVCVRCIRTGLRDRAVGRTVRQRGVQSLRLAGQQVRQ